MTEGAWLTPDEVAAILKVHKRTLRNMVQRGLLPPPTRLSHRIVRYRRADLERLGAVAPRVVVANPFDAFVAQAKL